MDNKEKEIFKKMVRFCNYRERAESEVKKKLVSFDISWKLQDSIFKKLLQENIVNSQRFANSYVLSKFKKNKWGKVKIMYMLGQKNVSKDVIQKALNAIDETTYINSLFELALKKRKDYDIKNTYALRYKIASFLQKKGYEANLVWDVLLKEIS